MKSPNFCNSPAFFLKRKATFLPQRHNCHLFHREALDVGINVGINVGTNVGINVGENERKVLSILTHSPQSTANEISEVLDQVRSE